MAAVRYGIDLCRMQFLSYRFTRSEREEIRCLYRSKFPCDVAGRAVRETLDSIFGEGFFEGIREKRYIDFETCKTVCEGLRSCIMEINDRIKVIEKDYIAMLPFKVGDYVSINGNRVWLVEISVDLQRPGLVNLVINKPRKDGTRSSRSWNERGVSMAEIYVLESKKEKKHGHKF